MELNQYFTGLVILVSVVHLAATVGYQLFSGSVQTEAATEQRPARSRDDWYLFFYCSDLTGPKTGTSAYKENRNTGQIKQDNPVPQTDKRRTRLGARC